MFTKLEGSHPSRSLRLLLADDDPLYLEMLATVLGADERIEIVGRARDGAEAAELAPALRPDVVVVDLHMPRMDGLEATRRIRRELRSARVLVLTSSVDPDDAERACAAGATAYLTKDCTLADLLARIVSAFPAIRFPAVQAA